MKIEDLIGYFTYRSFLDRPAPVDDFNNIKFAEASFRRLVRCGLERIRVTRATTADSKVTACRRSERPACNSPEIRPTAAFEEW